MINENTEERDRNDEMIILKWKIWTVNNIGESGAEMISESLKINTTLTKLDLSSDEKWSKMKWIIIKKTKEWKNEMKNINNDEDTKERDRNDKW